MGEPLLKRMPIVAQDEGSRFVFVIMARPWRPWQDHEGKTMVAEQVAVKTGSKLLFSGQNFKKFFKCNTRIKKDSPSCL